MKGHPPRDPLSNSDMCGSTYVHHEGAYKASKVCTKKASYMLPGEVEKNGKYSLGLGYLRNYWLPNESAGGDLS